MTRGIYFSGIEDIATYISPTELFTYATEDFTMCGWGRVMGPLPTQNFLGNYRVFGFHAQTVASSTSESLRGTNIVQNNDEDCRVTPMQMYHHGGGNVGSPQFFGLSSCTVTSSQDWFYALTYDHLTEKFNAYYQIDTSSPLLFCSGVATSSHDFPIQRLSMGGSFNYGGSGIPRTQVTNVKAWKRLLTSNQLINEMKSESVIDSANLYGWWKMNNSTDLADYSGNGRTLVYRGTLLDGSMDPVDIQPSPLANYSITGLRITH